MLKKADHQKRVHRPSTHSVAAKTAIAALAVATAVSATGALPALADQSSTTSSAVSNTSSDSSSTSSTPSSDSPSSSSTPSSSSSSSSSTPSSSSSSSSSTPSSSSSSSSSTPSSSSSSSSSSAPSTVVSAPLTTIDAPVNGASVTGKTTVSGWALNTSGIDRVDIYAYDSNGTPHELGSVKGSDLTNRTDVAQAYASGNYANIDASGYSLPVDTRALTSGIYTLAVAGIGQDGTVQWATCPFTVANSQSLTDIDAPVAGSAVSGKTTVSGWVLNASGIDRVDVYAYDSNGTPHSLGSVKGSDLTNRTDVAQAYASGNYANINASGYNLPIDANTLSAGTYTLAVAGIGKNGTVQWATIPIKVATLSAVTQIDSPAGNAVSGNVSIAGWALNASGIRQVDIYAYNSAGIPTMLGSVPSSALTARGDVQTAYPNYGILNSGYSLSVSTSQWVPGTYMLAVAGIGNNNIVRWATKTVTVTAPAPLTTIDTPSAGSTVNGTVDVSGWALNASGINRVDIYAYNEDGDPYPLGSVPGSQLTARGDVQNVLPQYNLLNSGYTLSVDTDDLIAGNYTLAVAGIGNNGTVQWATKNITVGAPFLLNIDSPSNGDTVSGSFNVQGWTLNHAGIYMVAAYVYDQNGALLKSGYVTGDQLTARPDVKSIYGKQPYGNLDASGFDFQVDVSTLPAGNYPVAFASIGNDGDAQILLGSINVK